MFHKCSNISIIRHMQRKNEKLKKKYIYLLCYSILHSFLVMRTLTLLKVPYIEIQLYRNPTDILYQIFRSAFELFTLCYIDAVGKKFDQVCRWTSTAASQLGLYRLPITTALAPSAITDTSRCTSGFVSTQSIRTDVALIMANHCACTVRQHGVSGIWSFVDSS